MAQVSAIKHQLIIKFSISPHELSCSCLAVCMLQEPNQNMNFVFSLLSSWTNENHVLLLRKSSALPGTSVLFNVSRQDVQVFSETHAFLKLKEQIIVHWLCINLMFLPSIFTSTLCNASCCLSPNDYAVARRRVLLRVTGPLINDWLFLHRQPLKLG